MAANGVGPTIPQKIRVRLTEANQTGLANFTDFQSTKSSPDPVKWVQAFLG